MKFQPVRCISAIAACVLIVSQESVALKGSNQFMSKYGNLARQMKKKKKLKVTIWTPNKPIKCEDWLDYSKFYDKDADDYYTPEDWTECIQWFESVVPSKSPAPSRSSIPSTSPSSKPSMLHSSFPSTYPTAQPSYIPSVTPSSSQKPSTYPSIYPSPVPSTVPSSSPTNLHSDAPSHSPSTTSRPSSIEKIKVNLPQFRISLTFQTSSTNVRMLSSSGQSTSDSLVDEKILFQAMFNILSSYYSKNVKDFYVLYFELKPEKKTTRQAQSIVSFGFSGHIILKKAVYSHTDVVDIPSDSELKKYTLKSFSSIKEQIPSKIKDATHSTFKSWLVSTVTPTSGLAAEDPIVNIGDPTGTPVVAIMLSAIAIISTLTAFGLIYRQSQNRANDTMNESPTKQNSPEEIVSKARKFRSPFMNVTPPEGTRKYFSRLDDDSISSSKAYSSVLNPKQSIVDSSFEESSYNDGSLQAPSLASSKFVGQSMDVESLAGMSALDNVRLNSVLQLEEEDVDNRSISSNDTGIFRKIWYSSKRRTVSKEGSIRKLTPPKKDTPTKQSPSSISPGKSTKAIKTPKYDSKIDDEKEAVDDTSLLGDQSSKSEYYGQNENENLFYNTLGQCSMVSDSSEDIDFNKMYNGGDGIASSSGCSDNASDLEVMSRGSRFSSVGGMT